MTSFVFPRAPEKGVTSVPRQIGDTVLWPARSNSSFSPLPLSAGLGQAGRVRPAPQDVQAAVVLLFVNVPAGVSFSEDLLG